jgi:hypothetical protein
MSETDNNSLKWKRWVALVVVSAVFTFAVEHLVPEVTRELIRTFDASFVSQLNTIRPLHIASLYYHFFTDKRPVPPLPVGSGQIEQEPLPPPSVWNPGNWIVALFSVATALAFEGPVGIGMLAIAVFVGIVLARQMSGWGLGEKLSVLVFCVFVPAVASVVIWAAWIVALASGRLLGWAVDAPSVVTTGPFLGFLLQSAVEERKHHFFTRLITKIIR